MPEISPQSSAIFTCFVNYFLACQGFWEIIPTDHVARRALHMSVCICSICKILNLRQDRLILPACLDIHHLQSIVLSYQRHIMLLLKQSIPTGPLAAGLCLSQSCNVKIETFNWWRRDVNQKIANSLSLNQ